MVLTIRSRRPAVTSAPSSSPSPRRSYTRNAPPTNSPPWTDERLGKLVRLWREGKLSASEIGDKLGVSRSAVLGKVRRYALTRRTPERKTP